MKSTQSVETLYDIIIDAIQKDYKDESHFKAIEIAKKVSGGLLPSAMKKVYDIIGKEPKTTNAIAKELGKTRHYTCAYLWKLQEIGLVRNVSENFEALWELE